MRTNTLVLALVLSLVGAASAAANDYSPLSPQSPGTAHIGTWKLNDGKSKFDTGATKNTTVVYASSGESVKITVDGTDGNGKPVHTEWTGKFDGKPYPVKGGPTADTRAYTVTDDHTLTFVEKKGATVAVGAQHAFERPALLSLLDAEFPIDPEANEIAL